LHAPADYDSKQSHQQPTTNKKIIMIIIKIKKQILLLIKMKVEDRTIHV
jgi:hypothetical protein